MAAEITMGRRKINEPEEGDSASPKTHQKARSIAEITDEETEDVSDKEFSKIIILFRDNEK